MAEGGLVETLAKRWQEFQAAREARRTEDDAEVRSGRPEARELLPVAKEPPYGDD